MNTTEINLKFDAVKKCYPNSDIICVAEYHLPGFGFTHLFKNKPITRIESYIKQIQSALSIGAGIIQLKLQNRKTKQIAFADFSRFELIDADSTFLK